MTNAIQTASRPSHTRQIKDAMRRVILLEDGARDALRSLVGDDAVSTELLRRCAVAQQQLMDEERETIPASIANRQFSPSELLGMMVPPPTRKA